MHPGLIALFFVLVIICGGPHAVLRAVSGLGCLILIAAILLLLLWVVNQIQNR
jgi:hypothetical protein